MMMKDRSICRRCHHLRQVDERRLCAGCASDLKKLETPKKMPPANEMDAPDGPKCACGKPSAFEDGSCVDCAVDGAKRVEERADKLADDLVEAGESESRLVELRPLGDDEKPQSCGWQQCEEQAEFVRDTPWGDLVVCKGHAHASLHGEAEPITERSSKIPTLPPVGAADVAELPSTAFLTKETDFVGLPPPEMWSEGFVPKSADAETVMYVAKNSDPDLAVLVSAPPPPLPLLEGATISVTSVSISQDEAPNSES